MIFEPKFNHGDTVYLRDDKVPPIEYVIDRINISSRRGAPVRTLYILQRADAPGCADPAERTEGEESLLTLAEWKAKALAHLDARREAILAVGQEPAAAE